MLCAIWGSVLMSNNSRALAPLRCYKHRDNNPEHNCGVNCDYMETILISYSPYDYIFDFKTKTLRKSNIRYLIK